MSRTSAGQSESMGWNASPDQRATGYFLYYGRASQNYTSRLDVGTNLQATVDGLASSATYYFAVSAYDANGNESPACNEIILSTAASAETSEDDSSEPSETSVPNKTPLLPNQIDPQMQAVLNELQALHPKPIEKLSAAEARKQPGIGDAVNILLQKRGSDSPQPVGGVTNISINGPGGLLPLRIYTPTGTGPFPVIVYFHGGGWVLGGVDTYDSSARELTDAVNAIVISVAYRQAPEHKFPAAHEDALAGYQWALKNIEKFNGDPYRVAVAGESAGGNLAVAVSLMARDRGIPLPVYQVVIYPVTQYGFETPSYRKNANARPLNKAMMKWFFAKYLKSPQDGKSALISLVNANLNGLPPATIITDQIDPLRSEGKMFVDRLQLAGVPITYHDYKGVTHEFFGMAAVVDQAKDAVNLVAAGLKSVFDKNKPFTDTNAPMAIH